MSFSAARGCSRAYRVARGSARCSRRQVLPSQILSTAWADPAWRSFSSHFFACLLVPSGARRDHSIEPRVGFHGVFQLGRPFPLEIELSNTGRPAEGTLDVQVWKGGATKGGAPYPVKYRRELFLAAQIAQDRSVYRRSRFYQPAGDDRFFRRRRQGVARARSAPPFFTGAGAVAA